jgi:hypothetical protein
MTWSQKAASTCPLFWFRSCLHLGVLLSVAIIHSRYCIASWRCECPGGAAWQPLSTTPHRWFELQSTALENTRDYMYYI